MRKVFLALHREELDQKKLSELEDFHNLSTIFPYEADRDYSGYFKFTVSRNPYSRIVSAYFDQYVYHTNDGVDEMFELYPPKNGLPNTFIEFLEYLQTVPDQDRDSHFKTQTYFHHNDSQKKKSSLFGRDALVKSLDFVGDISTFNQDMFTAYKTIFAEDELMYQRAIDEIESIPRVNSLIYSNDVRDNAADLTLAELNNLPYAPLPQYFFSSSRARKLVCSIYADDFRNFNYPKGSIPTKKPSPELEYLPKDFDWRTYLLLNPDLALHELTSKREVLRHYLQLGRSETNTRYYKIEAPEGFDWQKYLKVRPDLPAAGINTERDAIIHYLTYGKNEGVVL